MPEVAAVEAFPQICREPLRQLCHKLLSVTGILSCLSFDDCASDLPVGLHQGEVGGAIGGASALIQNLAYLAVEVLSQNAIVIHDPS